ncbi:hypothetical protein [Nannocystis sp.]|uniref:hypothetical protein n=1 Tax=Nannocystis sp. TaxID=1962667 RepID=UPI0025CEC61D|nr:hypothetical protein [Nannocystis sp.]MBK7825836.1 hypothetical protein [Nannocystis sp.]
MTLNSPGSQRLALAVLSLLVAACGDSTEGSGSISAGSSGGSSTGNPTTPTTTVDPTATTDVVTGGSGSQTGSATDSSTDPTAATSTSTSTSASTTDPTATTGNVQTDTSSANTGSTSAADTGTADTGSTGGTTDTTTNGVEPCACPDIEVPLDDGIFVLSDDAEMWKFFPETKQFEMLGAFNCGGMNGTFSMAVDRLGFAWVMFNNPQGDIWKVDVTNVAKCMDPGYNQGQLGVNYFGMAFVSNSESDQCDKLYGNTFNGIGGFGEGPNLGDFLTVDPDTLILSKIAKTKFNGAELTGTGDGRTFMFGGVNPSKLVEVDKANGQFIDEIPLPNLPLTNAFAFSFFAGDFYMFTESANPSVSKVTQFDYDDSDMNGKQDLTTIVAAAPIRIVGAGVSTCAPFAPQ